MRWSRAFIFTLKESPKDGITPSHIYLVRGGYIKQMGAGLYYFTPLGKRVLDKIMAIIREEMNRAGAEEVLLPFVTPYSLWEETGRGQKYGAELLRFQDRKEGVYVLSPTNEEAVVDLVRGVVKSYRQLPINLYQINLKFRDEIRPRFGLLRGREFIMKDAYSFHSSEEDLEREFQLMEKTYRRIFTRLGLEFRVVQADSGAIGGTGSREFMVLAETGEDQLAICSQCDYAANLEVATRRPRHLENPEKSSEIEEIYTPGITTIEQVAEAVGVDPYFIVKGVVKKAIYGNGEEELVVFFLRGIDQLEETKGINLLDALELVDATEEEIKKAGLIPGFIGPFGLPSHITYFIDEDLRGAKDLVAGANKPNYHIKGASLLDANLLGYLNHYRDLAQVKEGDFCPKCGQPLKITKGIEVGHIFKLGTVYSKKMGATFLDQQGRARPFIMGCYGIGVSRLIGAAVEQHHDEKGIKWGLPIAPYQIDIIISDIRRQKQVEIGEQIYTTLQQKGVEVILDDRKERFGVKITDFELIGFPIGVIVGRGVERGVVEIRHRQTGHREEVAIERAVERLIEIINE